MGSQTSSDTRALDISSSIETARLAMNSGNDGRRGPEMVCVSFRMQPKSNTRQLTEVSCLRRATYHEQGFIIFNHFLHHSNDGRAFLSPG